jgi:hypothetical protein
MGQKDLRDSEPAGAVEKDQVHSLKQWAGLQWALEEKVLEDLKRRKQWLGWGVFWWILS